MQTNKKEEGHRKIREGGLLLLAGVVFAILTHAAFPRRIYLFSLVAILLGGVQILRGLSQVMLGGFKPSGKVANWGLTPNEIDSVTCPHCGQELELEEHERKFGQYTCPTCKNAVELQNEQQDTTSNNLPPQEDTTTIFCPHCHEELEMDEEERTKEQHVCPVCSRTFEFRTDRQSSNTFACPHCGQDSELDEDEWRRGRYVCPTCKKEVIMEP